MSFPSVAVEAAQSAGELPCTRFCQAEGDRPGALGRPPEDGGDPTDGSGAVPVEAANVGDLAGQRQRQRETEKGAAGDERDGGEENNEAETLRTTSSRVEPGAHPTAHDIVGAARRREADVSRQDTRSPLSSASVGSLCAPFTR